MQRAGRLPPDPLHRIGWLFCCLPYVPGFDDGGEDQVYLTIGGAF